MAVSFELHNAGDPSIGAELRAPVEQLSDKAGDWRVSTVGSRESDGWEIKVRGPNGFERSYTLVGSSGRTSFGDREVLLRLLPYRNIMKQDWLERDKRAIG